MSPPLPLGRRTLLAAGAGGIFGALLARATWSSRAAAGEVPAKARACILLWLNGGPSHIDTFDPKPGRQTGGSFRAIPTRVPGLTLSEHLPMLADRADRIAVVRGIGSKEGNHPRAQYLVHTSYAPSPTVVHPSLGSWVGAKMGDPRADLPPFVSIGGPSFGAGFLGVQNGPFVLTRGGAPPPDVALPVGVDRARFGRRLAALEVLDRRFAQQTGDAKVEGRAEVTSKAVRLMDSPKIAAFDLAGEPEALRKAYGDTDFGRGCLVARRLVEGGVRFVEVVLDGWDTHKDNFGRTKELLGVLDPAISALLDDLKARGLLASTVVACMGEFGRTPKINADEGRDHWPGAWSAVLAGGGVRAGVVHGATDEDGAVPVGPPRRVSDVLATLSTAIGLDPGHTEMSPTGRPISVTDDGNPIRELLA